MPPSLPPPLSPLPFLFPQPPKPSPPLFSQDTKHAATSGLASGAGAGLGMGLVSKAFSSHKSSDHDDEKKKESSSQTPTETQAPVTSAPMSHSQIASSDIGMQTFTKEADSGTRMTFFIETYDPARGPVADSKAVLSQPMPGSSENPARIVGDDGRGHRVTTYIENRASGPGGLRQI
ncbi:hypothetical protein BJ684DRAFT_17833 [Piptocephalis cylindrospora]|uniref:Uncharacterized protein n=1 Tax=Piptocephalis cylindrospora TaxID=1907219 RepID=A0A4P9Y1B6_9FUNG|nr:hypothetical protein BJ684DRAFT_17833 [Piptocephalis cylindrospora]|eukprot:RKP11590.1 hypothetical protein BJ684DRAFT_17833 [Piptocephalis cylindrospora]